MQMAMHEMNDGDESALSRSESAARLRGDSARGGASPGAAERLHLSQPATSHALSRLRHRLKDQLFVRTPAGMTPTPRAEQLARPVRRALDELQLALEPDVFSPATAERIFVVALNNFGAIALAAPVVSECLKHAPRIRVSLRPSGTLDLLNFLERGELDLVISALDAPADRFAARTLVVDHYVVVMRRGHPAAKLTMDIEGFAKLPRLLMSAERSMRTLPRPSTRTTIEMELCRGDGG